MRGRLSSLFVLVAVLVCAVATGAGAASAGPLFLGDAGWTNDVGADLNGVVGTWDPTTRTAVLLADAVETIHLTGDNIVLDGDGRTVSGSGSGTGVSLYQRSGVTLRNLRIRNFATGIATDASTNILEQDNDIRGCGEGIFTHGDVNLTVRNTTISGCGIGLYARTGGPSLLEGNTISNCSFGIYSEAAAHTLRDNVVSQCGHGSYFEYSDPTLTNNVFANNEGCGILLRRITHAIATDNVIANNGYGIFFSVTCQFVTVNRNAFVGNDLAVLGSLDYRSYYDSFSNNNFVANVGDVEIAAGTYYPAYSFALAAPAGGNYWSGWSGPDLNADGFVDAPYVLAVEGASVLQDSLPLTAPVASTNHRPVLAPIGDLLVAENEPLHVVVTGYEADGDPIAFSAANLPPGATFDPGSGDFSWTPGFDQAGEYPGVEFTAADDRVPAGVTRERITLTVANVNRPPAFSYLAPPQGIEYQTLRFTVSATDPDGDVVKLSAPVLPVGAAFDPATGEFTWTPDGTQVGSHPFAFRATDDGNPPLSAELPGTIEISDDSIAPAVNDAYPPHLASDVPRSVAPRLTFDENVAAGAAYNQITFKRGGSTVTFAKSIDGGVLTLTPAGALAQRANYTVTIPAGALTDLAGNPLADSFVLKFTTGRN